MEPAGDLQQLIENARNGDEDALEKLLQSLRPQLKSIAQQYADRGQATDSTSDILQEAGVRIWQALDQFRGAENEMDSAMFRAWVEQIVHRTGLNAIRQRKALKRKPRETRVRSLQARVSNSVSGLIQDPAASGTTPSGHAQRTEQALLVQSALGQVTNELSRRIVILRFFDGLTLRDISDKVGLGYEATRDRYRRAMQIVEGALAHLE